MGALDYLPSLCMYNTSKTNRRSMETVEIKVKMDCDGCERRVKNAVKNIKGVKSVEVNRKQSMVRVSGWVDPNKVLKKVQKTGKGAEFWPYVPYNIVHHPHSAHAYDKRAPPGLVKNVQPTATAPTIHEETITYDLFSDDNTNAACSIM